MLCVAQLVEEIKQYLIFGGVFEEFYIQKQCVYGYILGSKSVFISRGHIIG